MTAIIAWDLAALFGVESFEPAPQSAPAIEGAMQDVRVLIVEDSYLTARRLARMVEDSGAQVIGPAPSVQAAMQLLDAHGCDAAVLDINLGNETVEPIAERLRALQLPFLFVTGYTAPPFMNEKFKDQPLLSKPVESSTFIGALRGLLRGSK